ncbi:MAG: phasin family protein [Ancalomicrobiaceae bacterium]|nr:phasin family protein [Ancalomicrobiaceae bacterium]
MTDKIPPFEIPEAVRSFTEQAVDQAKKAVDDALSAARGALDKAETSATGAQSSAFELQKTVMDLAEENVSAAFAHAQKLTQAKTLQDVVDLQNAFVKAQMAALGEQARVITEAAQKTASELGEKVMKG